jgi:hypothetical protein
MLTLEETELQLKIVAVVDRGGWYVVHVAADAAGPAFTYSIGLWRNFGHPEVIVAALEEQAGFDLIDQIGLAVKARQLTLNSKSRLEDFVEGAALEFITVDEGVYEKTMEWAVWYYCHHLSPAQRFPALQAVLPQRESGLYPWDDRYPEHLDHVQPLLGLRV